MSPANLQMLSVDYLIDHPDNPRDDLGNPQELAELANDLAANGNTIRLRVFPLADGPNAGKYLIIEGHRRTAAARLGRVAQLECWIDPTCNTLAKQIEAMLRENTHRVGITASNEAKAIQTLLDCEGMSVKKVAKAIHRSESFIRQRSRLAHMPPVAHQLVDGGGLTLEQSEAFDEFKDNPEATQELILVATNPRSNNWDWSHAVQRLRTRRDAPAKAAESLKVIEIIKAPVITEAETLTGKYDRDYNAKALTDGEHVAAGNVAHVDAGTGTIHWYRKSATAGARTALTEEQRAEKQKLKDISAGLEQDLAIWDEHLRKSLTDAGGGLPLTPTEKAVQTGLATGLLEHCGHYGRAGELLLNTSNGYSAAAELRAAVAKLRPLQLVMLRIELKLRPDRLHKPATWDTKPSPWKDQESEINQWIRIRREVFGYEPSVFEQEAIDHFIAQAAAGATASDEEYQEEEDDE